jgi:SNF2 family DNA or RNA helicase
MCDLFYDKYSGDANGNGNHSYENTITDKVTITDLNDGSYLYYFGKKALEVYNKIFEQKPNFTIQQCAYTSDMFKLKLYMKTDKITTIFVVIGVNVTMLEECITKKVPVPHVEFLKTLCRFHTAYHEVEKFYENFGNSATKIDKNIEYIIKTATQPVDYTFNNRIENPQQLKINLYEYQKCSVYWMMEKEKNKKVISYNLNNEVVLGSIFFDVTMQKFNLISDKKKVKFDGGCIIDEVGLGKTLQVVSLGLLSPSTNVGYTNTTHPNKFISKATLILCPNQLCGQWLREMQTQIKSESNIKIISILTKRDFDKLSYNDLLDADFVLLSYTFLDNKNYTDVWTKEIGTNKSFHKKPWNTTDQKKVSDVFTKMGSSLLKDPLNSLSQVHPMVQLIHWHRIVVDEFHEIYKNDTSFAYIDNMLPFLTSDFRWVVTATPFNTKTCVEKIFEFLTNYVNVDGNNIFKEEQILEYLSESCFRRNTKDSVKLEHTLPPIKEEIRWLKFSPTERMMYNAYLANLNNNKFDTYLRQLCCHPQLANETKDALSNCKTLADIEKMMVSHYAKEVDEAQEKVNEVKVRITKLSKKIRKLERKQKKRQLKKQGMKVSDSESNSDSNDSDGSDSDEEYLQKPEYQNVVIEPTVAMTTYKDLLKNANEKLAELTVVLNGKETTHNFFVNVVERIRKTSAKNTLDKVIDYDNVNLRDLMNQSTDDEDDDNEEDEEEEEPCGICLGEIQEHNIGVTRCGHIYCYDCIKENVKQYSSCPYCRKKITERDIYGLSYEMKKNTNVSPEDKSKNDLINDVGTKLANLILYLREIDTHVIIFSQWDDLLLRVGVILKDNKIKNVFCRGNCYQRDKAIREFNSDASVKVIMLSSGSSASGTNLTKASKVIFIDPIYGDAKFRKDQERQAVGRAHRLGQKSQIEIVRFIIKESIENDIYDLNCEEDKKNGCQILNSSQVNVV